MQTLQLRKLDAIAIHGDYKQTAEAASLKYVNDSTPGISRKRNGTGWTYFFQDERLTDKVTIQRIKSLVIPPAWTNVWI